MLRKALYVWYCLHMTNNTATAAPLAARIREALAEFATEAPIEIEFAEAVTGALESLTATHEGFAALPAVEQASAALALVIGMADAGRIRLYRTAA